jgi:phosphonopyruvate decarboxylase
MSELSISIPEACAVLREERGDAITILTMSAIAYWPDPRDDEYWLMGLMGAAGAIGLGVAVGKPECQVRVIDGDGSLLMQLGVLTAISDAAPPNLTHIVFDNGIYSISGGQPIPGQVDWPALFRAVGYADGLQCATADQLRAALRESGLGPRGIAVRCANQRPDYPPGAFEVNPAEEAARLSAGLASRVG